MIEQRYTYEQYAKAAKANHELIFETAMEDLTWLELGRLSLVLQANHPKWKLNREIATQMIVALHGKVSTKHLAEMACVSEAVVNSTVNELTEWRVSDDR